MTKKEEASNQLFQSMIEEMFKEELFKKISEENIRTIIREMLNKQNIKKLFEEFLIDNISHAGILDSGFFEKLIRKDMAYYQSKIKEIFDELINQKPVRDSISKEIKDTYFNNFNDYCVFEEMFENMLKGYEFQIVPKGEKVKKDK